MFGDIGKIMKIAGKMKTELPALKEKLAATEYTAEAGGGSVSATVNGKLAVVDIAIGQAVREDPNADFDMIEDLVKAAIAAAQTKAATAAAEAMKELTGGMDIPGMEGLDGLM
ncbi:MAG: YbaB/EbfC family nucleoid-associated protein [Planctomycetes bacterium]|nr:YbaB/EbfC family nucleoid-associated protein [Planctomycetota bacterium]